MARRAIQLETVSGRWKYHTWTNDPLFSSLLGSMVEEGLELPPKLMFDGSLAKVLEEGWEYYERLAQWMAPTILMGNSYELLNHLGDTPVLLSEILKISRVLDLPEGWEYFVPADSLVTQRERLNHHKAMLRFIETFDDSLAFEKAHAMSLHDPDVFMKDVQMSFDVPSKLYFLPLRLARGPGQLFMSTVGAQYSSKKTINGYLDSYVREYFLLNFNTPAIFNTTKLYEEFPWKDMALFAEEVVEEEKRDDFFIKYSMRLTRLLAGVGTEIDLEVDELYLAPNITEYRSSLVDPGETSSNLLFLYKNILEAFPLDTHPTLFGLGPIILDFKRPSLRAPFTTLMSSNRKSTLPYVASYMQFTGDNNRMSSVVFSKNYDALMAIPAAIIEAQLGKKLGVIPPTLKLPRELFSDCVRVIGESLGLYVLNRMLLSLLHFMTNMKTKKKPSAKEIIRNERLVLMTDAMEKYLADHAGEDEGFKQFATRDMAVVVSQIPSFN